MHLLWKELQKKGCYPDPFNPEHKVLRKDDGKCWGSLVANEDFNPNLAILPQNKDIARAQSEGLKVIHTVLDLETSDSLISYTAALNFIGKDRIPAKKAPHAFHRSANLERQRTNSDGDDELEEQGTNESTEREAKPSLLSTNNAFIDIPAEMDLNSTEAVKGLYEYVESAREQILGKCSAAEEIKDEVPILRNKSVYLCGDGEPSIALKRLQRKDPGCTGALSTFGGFHTEKKAYSLIGALFGYDGVIGDLHKVGGRDSIKKMNFVCNPGDPNDAERETMIMVYAIMTVAIRELAAIKATATDEDDNSKVSISAEEVANHLLSRAKKFPAAAMTLIFLRLWEWISVSNCAEKNANSDAYLAALRLIGGFCTTGHAVGYVSLITDCLRDYHCMSEMDRSCGS